MFVGAYVGARPLGRPLPPLADAPQGCPAVPLHLIHAFARDAAHDGMFEFYDPWQLEQGCRQQWGHQRGMLSMGGAGFSFGPSVPLGTWVANAAASLQGMLERYGLCGLDINFEEGLDTPAGAAFPEAMAGLTARLKAWRPTLLVTVAPFDEVWPQYRRLLQLAGSNIDLVLWQLYAELEEPECTAEQAVAVYERLAAEVPGGYARLALGVNTEPDERRGPALPALLSAFVMLKARGLGGAFVWALDNSAGCGYQAERELLRLAAEPAGASAAAAAARRDQGCCTAS